jgi:transposase-like protein
MNKKEVKKTRIFSKPFKESKVREYEEGKITVLQISKLYNVSQAAIYKWIKKYSGLPPTERYVVEHKSEGSKQMELLKRIAELERIIGVQKIELLFNEKIIEAGSKLIGEDLKKKHDMRS